MTEEKKPEETTKTEEAPKAETPKTEEVPKADVPKKKTASKKSTDFQKPETVEDAVKLYNEMVLTAIDVGISKVIPVEKFVDLKTGVRACERLHESIQKARGPKSSKKEKDDMPKKTAKKSTTKKKAAKKSGARGPIAKITDETKVTWVSGKENPYREGTGKWKRTEVVRTSTGSAVTVKTLQGKKVKRGTIRTLVREGVAKLS
jgi:hypothetical protein